MSLFFFFFRIFGSAWGNDEVKPKREIHWKDRETPE